MPDDSDLFPIARWTTTEKETTRKTTRHLNNSYVLFWDGGDNPSHVVKEVSVSAKGDSESVRVTIYAVIGSQDDLSYHGTRTVEVVIPVRDLVTDDDGGVEGVLQEDAPVFEGGPGVEGESAPASNKQRRCGDCGDLLDGDEENTCWTCV